MAFVHGKGSTFSIDNTAGTPIAIGSYLNSVDLPQSVETAEVTAFGATAKAFIPGLEDATISLSGPWDSAVDAVFMGGAEPASRTFSYVIGGVTYSGEAICTGYTVQNPVSDVLTWSADLQVTGVVTRA